jgi:hypothetical protein
MVTKEIYHGLKKLAGEATLDLAVSLLFFSPVIYYWASESDHQIKRNANPSELEYKIEKLDKDSSAYLIYQNKKYIIGINYDNKPILRLNE